MATSGYCSKRISTRRMSTVMSDATPATEHREPEPASIHPLFRNGSLTAISVLVGFSLSFLSHWAGTPGQWHVADLIAVTLIVIGIGLQIWALSSMLLIPHSLPKSTCVRSASFWPASQS
jgi:hypothetical protein